MTTDLATRLFWILIAVAVAAIVAFFVIAPRASAYTADPVAPMYMDEPGDGGCDYDIEGRGCWVVSCITTDYCRVWLSGEGPWGPHSYWAHA